MTVAVVGDGAAVDAVHAALADVDVQVESAAVAGVADAEFAVVVGVAGTGGFRAANEHARDGDTPLVTVEVGGLGGRPLDAVDAGVAYLSPRGPCFECLAGRVTATGQESAASPSADRAAVRLAGAHAGRLATDALRGNATPGTVVELPHAQRQLAPLPNCDCADGPLDRNLPREADDRSLDDALDAAEQLVDDRVGVLTAVGERESFPAPYYLAMASDTSTFSDAEAASQAAGVAGDWNEAYMKAVGEGFERYAAGVYRTADFETAPVDHEAAIPPQRFVRPDSATDGTGDHERVRGNNAADDTDERERVRGNNAADGTGEHEWVRGEHLATGDDALLPAERVVFPPPEDSTGPSITTGLGLGNAGVGAVLSGLYETIERDATMLAWYSTFEPLGLAVDDPGFAELEKRARAENLQVTTLLCTQDVDVPVVAAAVQRDDWPRFALGSAADLDATAAARSALCEALQNWMELRAMGPDAASDEDGAIGTYADFPRSVRGFVDPDTTIAIDDVDPDTTIAIDDVDPDTTIAIDDVDPDTTIAIDDVGTHDPPTGIDELDAVLGAVTAADLDPYAARLTTRDLDAAGFEAVRVLVPKAQPLFVDTAFFGDRARTVPRDLGFQPRLDKPFHPFP